MSRVFLGGTCNGSKWRESKMIPLLKEKGVDYFNPVVEDWTEAAKQQEIYERENDDFVVYVISPLIAGYYALAEVVEDSIRRPEKTIFHVMGIDDTKTPEYSSTFTKSQVMSLDAIGKMVERNGGTWCNTFEEIAEWVS